MRNVTGVDFKDFKPASLERRLGRRMALRELRRLGDYLELLRTSRTEVEALAEDPSSTSRRSFGIRRCSTRSRRRFPAILEHKAEAARSASGCRAAPPARRCTRSPSRSSSTSRRPAGLPLQIFATDVSERTIDEPAQASTRTPSSATLARSGGGDSSRAWGGYRVNKAVRDACVFVRHDLARDRRSAARSVSCRNVLIYFGAALQKKVLATFHYALNEPGFLLLGRSESITGFARLFAPVDRANKRVRAHGRAEPAAHGRQPAALALAHRGGSAARPSRAPRDMTAHAERVLLARYGPPGVIVNERMELLQFRGRTGPYLEPAPGQPQNNLLKMARVGLVPTLRAALAAAKKGPVTVRKEGVRFDDNGAMRTCNVVVVPLAEQADSKQHVFLVLFEPFAPAGGRMPASRSALPARAEERLVRARSRRSSRRPGGRCTPRWRSTSGRTRSSCRPTRSSSPATRSSRA